MLLVKDKVLLKIGIEVTAEGASNSPVVVTYAAGVV